jgi:undecaprenyl-diphosphatase
LTANPIAPQWTVRLFGHGLGRVLAVGGAAALFGVLVMLVRAQWLPLESVDHGLAEALNRAVADRHWLVVALSYVSRLGSYGMLGWLVGIASVLLLVRRRYRLAAYLLVTSAGALVLDPTLKLAVGRLRPIVKHPVAVGGGDSFPSGHALASIIVYGALVLVFAPALSRRARGPVTAALAVLVAAIGVSRLALGVHFLSDVVGAWCLGVAWLGITAYAFELGRVETGRRPTQPLAEGLEPESATELKPARPAVAAGEKPAAGTRAGGMRAGWAVASAVVAWTLLFGALCALGIPLARYRHGNGDVLGDTTIPHLLAAHRTAGLTRLAHLGASAGNTHAIMAVGLVAGTLALAIIRRWRPVLFLLATMIGELTLFLATAAIVGRARPDTPHLDGPVPTSSFPSGHVAATICLYSAIAILVLPRTRRWWRWIPVALAVLMAAWVAFARMYQGMHHPTDIAGSLILAAGWLTAMVVLVRPNVDVRAGDRT